MALLAEKIVKILFYISLFSFTLAEVSRFTFGSTIAVTLNDVVLLFLVLTWAFSTIFSKKRIQTDFSIIKSVIIFIGICVLSLLFNWKNLTNYGFLTSFLYIFRWIGYMLVYFVVCSFDKSFKKSIQLLMCICGFMILLLGYVQCFFYPNLRNLYYLGWDEHIYRMFSTFLDPNFAAVFFVLLLLLSFDIFFKSQKEKNKSLFLFSGIVSLSTFFGIFLTYSRTGLVMLVVSICVFLFLSEKKIWIAGLLTASVLLLFVSQQFFKSESTNILRITSSTARVSSSQKAITIFSHSPIFGVGFDAYRYANQRLGFSKDNNLPNHAGAGTDNSFLFVLATTGVVGFAGYIFLLRSILRINNSSLIVSSYVGIFVASFFINALFYPFLMQWLWMLIALKENT